jgi:hypothetical protein
MRIMQEPYLTDAFLDRVRRAYRRAVIETPPTRGLWAQHDERRADVHAALVADGNNKLKAIFADPTITDLYYGVDRLCRSHVRLNDPSEFISEALTDRDSRARSAAYQIKRLLELSPGARSVVEIGPGMGRAAYYGHLAGMDYTTIDLPLGIVAQACFLGRALGPDALWFAGEDDLSSVGRIKLLQSAPNRRFDLALNVDSITEMPAAAAFDYFRWAAAHVRYLLSINHDKNLFTVAQLAAFSAPKMIVSRRPCPVWDGYTEEAFLLNGLGILPPGSRGAAFETFVFARRIGRGIARRWRSLTQSSSHF